MKENNMSSWRDVFAFTFMQQIKGKSFKRTTILIGLICFILVFLALVVSGKRGQEESVRTIENIKEVYILDETGDFTEINLLIQQFIESDEGGADLKDISFMQIDAETKVTQAMSDIENVDDGFLINIKREEEGILLQALLPQETSINEEETDMLLEAIMPVFEMYRIGQSGLSMGQISLIQKPVITSFTAVGEEEDSFGEAIIKYMVPMIYSFIIYFLLIFYVQSIMNNLIIEKTSKMTEMILTAIGPEMVITGKILAMCLVAVLQFFSWILCGLVGFLVGHVVLKSQYQDYVNPVIEIIELVQNNTDGSAFSTLAIILSIVALCAGFLFYFSFAGVIGSTLNKTEDVSNGTGIVLIPIIFGFMAAMMVPMYESGFWIKFINIFPFVSPFVLPTSILNGSVTTVFGLLAIGILIISTIICFILAGKLYKGLIFFKGEKLTVSNIFAVFK